MLYENSSSACHKINYLPKYQNTRMSTKIIIIFLFVSYVEHVVGLYIYIYAIGTKRRLYSGAMLYI